MYEHRGGGTGRLVFRNVEVPRENLIGELHGGAEVFNQMMIPERLTSAAASLGVRAALDVAARYSDKRRIVIYSGSVRSILNLVSASVLLPFYGSFTS
jgi:alkylation response protein AidB-like acyl-CoA dehydrogenase